MRGWRLQLGIQGCEITGVTRLQNLKVGALVTQSVQNSLSQVHLCAHGIQILWRLFTGHQHPDIGGAISHGGQPDLQAHGRGVPQRHGQHPCWHAPGIGIHARRAAQVIEQLGPGLLAVEEQSCLLAAGTRIGG